MTWTNLSDLYLPTTGGIVNGNVNVDGNLYVTGNLGIIQNNSNVITLNSLNSIVSSIPYVDNIYPRHVDTKPSGSDSSVTIGDSANSGTGFNNIAIGVNAIIGDKYTDNLVMGCNAQADSLEALTSTASGNSTILGNGAISHFENTTLVGKGSYAGAINSCCLGYDTSADYNHSVALGCKSDTGREYEVSIGNSSLKRYLSNLRDPTKSTDAATKNYVDTEIANFSFCDVYSEY